MSRCYLALWNSRFGIGFVSLPFLELRVPLKSVEVISEDVEFSGYSSAFSVGP